MSVAGFPVYSDLCRVSRARCNLQRAVPRNFAYKTRLAALIVQALKATGAENIGPEEISALKNAIDKHPDKDAFRSDVLLMPVWMKTIITPLL